MPPAGTVTRILWPFAWTSKTEPGIIPAGIWT